MVYKFKEGSRFPIQPQVAGETLEKIRKRNKDKMLLPQEVVDAARSSKSPLHSCFDWDDVTAANEARLERARMLIRCVIRVVKQKGNPEKMVLQYVNLTIPDEGRGYVTTARVMSDEELRRRMIADALKGLEAWRKRHAMLSELQGIFDAIDKLAADFAVT